MRIIVAERAKTLAALKQSENQFRTAFDRAPIGMALVSLDGLWLQVNESLCRIVGYSEAELVGREFNSITHPEDIERGRDRLRDMAAGTCSDLQVTKRYLHKKGHVVWVQVSISLVKDGPEGGSYLITQTRDITEQRQAEERLRASEEGFRAMFELAGVGKAEGDARTGRFIRVNRKLCEITGYSQAELLTKNFADLTHPDDLEDTRRQNRKLMSGEISEFTIEKRYVRKDGRTIWVSLNVAGMRDPDGTIVRGVATIQDMTDRKRAEWIERDRRHVLEMVAQNMPLPGVIERLAEAVDRQVDGNAALMIVRDGNIGLHAPNLPPAWCLAFSARLLRQAAALASSAWDAPDRCGVTFCESDAVWEPLRGAAELLGIRSCWTVPIRSNDGSALGALSVFCREHRPPTEQELRMLQLAASIATICLEHHNNNTALARSVRHDLLTGIPNRICFEDRLETAMRRARREASQVALFYIDIDRFKHVNDTLGHEAGDVLLQQFATRLARSLRDHDTLARMGGDEFALIVPDVTGAADAIGVADRLMACLAEPIHVAGRDLVVTASIGIALYPRDGDDSAALQRSADKEMYRIKQRGRNGYSIVRDSAKALR
jgi:diguanylate cyclase (GGDEF)-like protein/PAS domain S-box-containing protein